MKIKNLQVLMLFRWLDVPLHGEQLRARNKFISILEPLDKEIEATRKKMLAEFSEQDEKGEPVIENGLYKIADDKKEEFIKNYNETYLEKVNDIDVPGEVRANLKTILMEKLTKGLNIEDGKVFEQIMENL